MTEELTPERARHALSDVERMQRKGWERGTWPEWAKILETILGAVVIGMSGYPVLTGYALGLALSGVALRYWLVFRFKAFRHASRLDYGILVAALALAGYGRWHGLNWLAVLAAAAWALWTLVRRRLDRRGGIDR